MEKSLQIGFALFLISISSVAQSNFTDDLNEFSQSAIQSRNAAKNIGLSFKTLAISCFIQQNPDADPDPYLSVVADEIPILEEAVENMAFYANEAAAKNANIDPEELLDGAQLIQNRMELIELESENLAQEITSGSPQTALEIAQNLRSYIFQVIGTSRDIALEAQSLKDTPMPLPLYDVRIVLVDGNGHEITGSTGLQGFYAFDEINEVYYYAGEWQTQDLFLFTDLPESTYTFGAFDGYFDGASSTTLTLSPELPVNEDGELEVELVYWSE